MEWDDIRKEFWSKFNIAYIHNKGFAGLGIEICDFFNSKFSEAISQAEQRGAAEERRRVAGIISRIVKQAVDESPDGRMEVWERTISDFIRLEIAFNSGKEDLPELIDDNK